MVAPFGYPHRLILFLGTLRVVFHLPYRQLEGASTGLEEARGDSSPPTTPPEACGFPNSIWIRAMSQKGSPS
jgi:hypothetical protein